MKVLHLTLKKKWFDMIASGEKKEEYREFKQYWIKRFGYESESDYETGYYDANMFRLPDVIRFTNGYGKDKPTFDIEVTDWNVGKSKHPEWGGNTESIQFIFKLGNVLTPLHQKQVG